jgi:hypothetical protein
MQYLPKCWKTFSAWRGLSHKPKLYPAVICRATLQFNLDQKKCNIVCLCFISWNTNKHHILVSILVSTFKIRVIQHKFLFRIRIKPALWSCLQYSVKSFAMVLAVKWLFLNCIICKSIWLKRSILHHQFTAVDLTSNIVPYTSRWSGLCVLNSKPSLVNTMQLKHYLLIHINL